MQPEGNAQHSHAELPSGGELDAMSDKLTMYASDIDDLYYRFADRDAARNREEFDDRDALARVVAMCTDDLLHLEHLRGQLEEIRRLATYAYSAAPRTVDPEANPRRDL
jgi:hypothetical protein